MMECSGVGWVGKASTIAQIGSGGLRVAVLFSGINSLLTVPQFMLVFRQSEHLAVGEVPGQQSLQSSNVTRAP
jgi:hypothetical protein